MSKKGVSFVKQNHQIQLIQINPGTKFHLKQRSLIFLTKFFQKGYFQSFHWRRSAVFIVNFEDTCPSVSIVNLEQVNVDWVAGRIKYSQKHCQ